MSMIEKYTERYTMYYIQHEYIYGWDFLSEGLKNESFATLAQAKKEIKDLIETTEEAVRVGHMEDAFTADELRVIKITNIKTTEVIK